jgi:phosphodiesterase/alkaline phosphatase D-like protein
MTDTNLNIWNVRFDGGGDRGTMSWTTNQSSNSRVEYGTTQRYGFQTPLDTELVTYHAVVLTGLRPNTRYFYRLKSRNAAGRVRFYESGFLNPPLPP